MQKFVILRVTYVMAFTRVLADDVVEAIFDDDFGLSDEDESGNQKRSEISTKTPLV